MGVNVFFWGPPGWRITFAIMKVAFILVTHYKRTKQFERARSVVMWAARTLRAFFNAPPCIFCRKSCPQFVKEIEKETGLSLEEHLWLGKGLEFGYTLRSKVNMKLHTQHLKQFSQLSGVEFAGQSCSIPPRTIPFNTWRARLMLQERMFSTQDVILLLNAFRLDHAPELGGFYVTLLHGLSILIRIESLQHDAPRNMFAPMRMLAELVMPIGRLSLLQPDMLKTKEGFERVLFQIMCGMKGLRPDPHQYASVAKRLFEPYNIMRAGVICQKETCAVPTVLKPGRGTTPAVMVEVNRS